MKKGRFQLHQSVLMAAGIFVCALALSGKPAHADRVSDKNKAKCADFGFQPGTDAFAQCVMKLSLKDERDKPLDHDAFVRRYRDLSMARKGDDRYKVCSAAMIENQLDITINKWVGPNCQMAPD